MSKKRQDVLATAETLFYESGFHSVGIKKIISEANVSLMTVYNHFDSKERLILEVLDEREKRYFASMREDLIFFKEKDKKEKAKAIGKAHMHWLEKHEANGCLFLRAKEEYTAENQEIVERVDAHKEALLAFFHEYGLNESESLRLAILTEGATSLAETTKISKVREELLASLDSLIQE